MPLLGIDIAVPELRQRCVYCGATNHISLKGLVLGTGVQGRVNPDAMSLPPCPSCGAQETLIRNWDITPPPFRDSAHCEQRAAVNALAQHLKQSGRQNPLAKPVQDQETSAPPELMNIEDARALRLVSGVPGEQAWNASLANVHHPMIKYGA